MSSNSFITENLLTENYAWVDKLLREKYYDYAVTFENYHEFCCAGILTENYICKLEEIENHIVTPVRKRSEDDISDYEENINKMLKRIGCQSPSPSNEYLIKDQQNEDKFEDKFEDDSCSLVSELTDDEYGIKIWPIEDEYEEYYKEEYDKGYEEYYEDDVSEINGYYSYGSSY